MNQQHAQTLYALVDCNNFYASCERVFNPALRGQPVVVLSNNDGCIIARSSEAKALGIPMGEPLFKFKRRSQAQQVHVRSANFALYGDMSRRVMSLLADAVPRQEVYSIDECFLDLSGLPGDLVDFCETLQQRVYQGTGIPVSIGLGPTKTLAKLANRCAKKRNVAAFDLRSTALRDQILATTDVGDIWGIGRRWAKRLQAQGVETAADFARMPTRAVRQMMGVVGARTAAELRGVCCLTLEDMQEAQKMLNVARSFHTAVETKHDLRERLVLFANMAAEKARRRDLMAAGVLVFARTDRFRPDQPFHRQQEILAFDRPSQDTQVIVQYVLQGLDAIYKPGLAYKKAGICLMDTLPTEAVQPDLWSRPPAQTKAQAGAPNTQLMAALDQLNTRYVGKKGQMAVALGQVPKSRTFFMRQSYEPRRYTTRWEDIMTAHAR